MGIQFSIRGIPGVGAFLQRVQAGFKNQALLALSQYIVGDDSGAGFWHGLKHYPAYRYVSMKQAYGGFISDKQRRYVMARINEGSIDPGVPHRTGEFQRGWSYVQSPNSIKIVNATPYGGYLMGDQQTRMSSLIGWRRTAEVIQSNMVGALRYATMKLNSWIAQQKG